MTVAVAASVGKRGVGTAFTLEERVQMLRSALAAEGLRDVDVQPFTGLLVDFCAGRRERRGQGPARHDRL